MTTSHWTEKNTRELLTAEELAQVTRKSNLQGWSVILFDWMIIVGIFCIAAVYPNPFTLIAAVVLLGGRQLALGIVVHETGHRTLFQSQALNDFCGKWLSGYWVFSDKESYMKGHLKHHQNAGTAQDPDLPNYSAYPVSRESLRRKIKRDLTGQIGWRRMKSIGHSIRRIRTIQPRLRQTLIRSLMVNLAMDLPNYSAYPVSRESLRRKIKRDLTGQIGWRRMKSIGHSIRRIRTIQPRLRQTLIRSLMVNLAMLITMTLFGHPWLYLLWVIAFMTSHMLVTRVRQIAEHAAVPDNTSLDIRRNTRTIHISRLERLLIAPHRVNYHIEHHLMPSVPIYHLHLLHDLLLRKGYYEGIEFSRGYYNLLKQVTYPAAQGTVS